MTISVPSGVRVWLATGRTDMRRGMNGLSLQVQEMLKRDPFGGIALGRKSWLFAGSDRGGKRAAAMYSLIVTAKLNDIDAQAWLADVLARIAGPSGRASRRTVALELAPCCGACQPGGLTRAGIPHVFTIARVAEMLGEDEDRLHDLSLDPEDGHLGSMMPTIGKSLPSQNTASRASSRSSPMSAKPAACRRLGAKVDTCGAHRRLTH